MRQCHALGVAGAARGVLDERNVVATHVDRRRHAALLGQLLWRDDMAQSRHAGLQQAGDDHRLGNGHQQRGAGVVEDAGVPQHMLFELRGARRRVDRHRDRARPQDAQVGAEIRGRCRQHDGHALAWLHARLLQAGCHCRAGLGKLAVAERVLAVVDQAGEVGAVGVCLQVPLEHVEQRPGAGGSAGVGRRLGWKDGDRRLLALCAQLDADVAAFGAPLGVLRRGQQVADRLGALQRVVRQSDAECALGAQQQFRARQAVEAEIAIERAGQRDRRQAGCPGVQFTQGAVHDCQQFRRGDLASDMHEPGPALHRDWPRRADDGLLG